jgi:hypothetical protein
MRNQTLTVPDRAMGIRELAETLRFVGSLLNTTETMYCFDGRFRFELAGDWSLVVSSDLPGRIRLEACNRGRVRVCFWCAVEDRSRLESLVLAARREAFAIA